MSTLFNVLFAWKCSSTHHKMALDALKQLTGNHAEQWRNLCLNNIDAYLDGSKAPDNKFKDFRNHVLHVQENHWGGAIGAAEKWYEQTLDALRNQKWTEAVYAAGVLSHYYTDPLQPLHTGQCEAEGAMHRACEWSIACAYRELTEILENDLGGWPNVTVPAGDNWLAQMVTAGADLANPHYDACLDHYNLDRGVKNPPAGLDQDLKDRFAKLIGYAVVGYARVMDRLLVESQAAIPTSNLTLQSVIATLSIPVCWVTKKLHDARERSIVESMYQEFQKTGKVMQTLSEDDKAIRALHAEEILKKPLHELDAEQPRPIGTANGTGASVRPRVKSNAAPGTANVQSASQFRSIANQPSEVKVSPGRPLTVDERTQQPVVKPPLPGKTETAIAREPFKASTKRSRFYLARSMSVESAPSIGPKTALCLESCEIKIVADLLQANPEKLASSLNDRGITSETIIDWQHQAELCCDVPNLRGHDAQILTACGIRNRASLSTANPKSLFKAANAFVETSAGQRILRGGTRPDLAEVSDWIAWANENSAANAA